jgi:hypothetical protein
MLHFSVIGLAGKRDRISGSLRGRAVGGHVLLNLLLTMLR